MEGLLSTGPTPSSFNQNLADGRRIVIFNIKSEVEEVFMKWMDGPSVTEMERGGVYDLEIEISSIHFCDTWSVHPFHIDQNSYKKKYYRNLDILSNVLSE